MLKNFFAFISLPLLCLTLAFWFLPSVAFKTLPTAVVAPVFWSNHLSPQPVILESKTGVMNCLVFGHQFRISQYGTLKKIQINFPRTNEWQIFKLQVWRYSGGNYDLVAESENLADRLISTQNEIYLNSPLNDIHEGDYYGFLLQAKSDGFDFNSISSNQVDTYCADHQLEPTQVNWFNQPKIAHTALLAKLFMDPPQVIFIGDSIISGFPEHVSFLETVEKTDLQASIAYFFSHKTNLTVQNAGIGGQTTRQIAARLKRDVLNQNPRVVVIEGGVNDLNLKHFSYSFISNWDKILHQAEDNQSIKKIVILKILPWSNGSDEKLIKLDRWNQKLTTLANFYSKTVVVDLSHDLGENRPSGLADNLWNLKKEYSIDGVHLTKAGNQKVAEAIIRALKQDQIKQDSMFVKSEIKQLLEFDLADDFKIIDTKILSEN